MGKIRLAATILSPILPRLWRRNLSRSRHAHKTSSNLSNNRPQKSPNRNRSQPFGDGGGVATVTAASN
jgi:hypothetical protein